MEAGSGMTAAQVAPSVRLNNGVEMPQVGLGCANGLDNEGMVRLVTAAYEIGYRAFDTAPRYHNEHGLGLAVRHAGIPRAEVFVTTKVWSTDQGRDATRRAFDASLDELDMEYIDLYLIHFPAPMLGLYVETWLTLEEFYQEGRARAIGVANFEPHHLAEVIKKGSVVPAVNQVELHPRLQQRRLREFNAGHGIRTEAWSPMAMGQTLREPAIADMAERYSATPAQIILRWHLQHGTIIIPRTRTPDRLAENLQAASLPQLEPADMSVIDALDCEGRIGPNPDEWLDGPRGSVLKNLDQRYEKIMRGAHRDGC
jgi:diketogulonate reductase-like aldo/keto reductase